MSLTQRRDLRSGKPVWTAYRTGTVPQTRLLRSTRADVVIVGAGISGALLAQSLAEAGLRPLILERRRGAALGSTAASTALLMFELDQPLIQLTRRRGRRDARGVWRASREALDELRTRTHRLRIAAGLQTRPSVYVAGSSMDARALAAEVRARQRAGLPSELLSRRELRHHFGIDRAAAILSHGSAEANPVELCAGYLRAALRAGARLHAPHEVCDIEHGRQVTTLCTRDGVEIAAKHVVFCTGYELPRIVSTAGNRVISTWAIASDPLPAERLWPQGALLWEASDPYLYARTLPDGRVLCGGEDEDFGEAGRRDAMTAAKSRTIARKLNALLPGLNVRPRFAWAGSFGSSIDSVPTIGEIPGHRRCHAVMGFGGNGLTFSMLAARLVGDAILRRKAADARLFAF